MSLANSAYLWSLLGLLIPVAIHLLSRKEGKIIKLGSLRHVHETSTQQFRGIRLNEIFLLVLRCTLIVILSLVLSGLHFNHKKGKWILVETGTEKNKNVQAAVDSLEKQGYEQHKIASVFSSAAGMPAADELNYWSVIQELKNLDLEEAVIFSWTKAEHFRGRRQPVPANLKIIPVQTAEKKIVLGAVQKNDSVIVRTGMSNALLTSFENKIIQSANDTIKATPPRQIKIILVSDPARLHEKQILAAAVRAIDPVAFSSFQIIEKKPAQFSLADSADWVFWMSEDKPPETNSKILQWAPEISTDLIRQTGYKKWVLNRLLTEENALKNNLVLSLASLLTYDSAWQKTARLNDQRILPEAMAWISDKEGQGTFILSPGFPVFLIILFVLLFMIERYLAFQRKQ
ncbi:MAG: hypothetical protein OJF59_000531 [Cytophagales bacterium]|jgi:hypothetical protein|nr:BatA domain-containing protein [Bacteroidota bacterium]MBS1981407.1 BatA domain-containing protein [Bacteroidota bacterium]WHZ06778.1 MAG: hypothetical protein OJF59_000531 [Cytophagales bacterium]